MSRTIFGSALAAALLTRRRVIEEYGPAAGKAIREGTGWPAISPPTDDTGGKSLFDENLPSPPIGTTWAGRAGASAGLAKPGAPDSPR
jgi:hypothetical protein